MDWVRCGVNPAMTEKARVRDLTPYTALLQMWKMGMIAELEWYDHDVGTVRTCRTPSFAFSNKYRIKSYKPNAGDQS